MRDRPKMLRVHPDFHKYVCIRKITDNKSMIDITKKLAEEARKDEKELKKYRF